MYISSRKRIIFLLILNIISINGEIIDILERDIGEGSPYVKSEKVQLSWSGGKSTCNKCSKEEIITTDYACNFDGTWENGEKQFLDPLPYGSILTQVKLDLVGRFNCNNETNGTYVFLSLNDALIDVTSFPTKPEGCSCPLCAVSVEIDSKYKSDGWEYTYQGLNRIQVLEAMNETKSICLSYINVTLIYVSGTPDLLVFTPQGSPYTGGTNVTIFGNPFIGEYSCIFGNVTVSAFQVTSLQITCLAPPQPVGEVEISVLVQENGQIVSFGNKTLFMYYEEPVITSLYPSSGSCNDIELNILMIGTGMLNLSNPLCLWGDQPISATYINETTISCDNPAIQALGVQLVSLSLDGRQHRTNAVQFICTAPPSPTTHAPTTHFITTDSVVTTGSHANKSGGMPGWAWIVVVFGGATIIVVAILFFSKKYGKNDDIEDNMNPNASSRLLNPDGSPNDTSTNFIKKIDINSIKLLEKIGKGTFGEVFKGVWNGTDIGVKFLTSQDVSDQFLTDFYKEVSIMRALRHPNILQFLGACYSPPKVCILMEYMPMGSLFKILHDENVKNLGLDLLKKMMMDAAKGMNYLHKSDPMVIHRDLKSHNLLVDENWKVKVCDFGLSKILETQSEFTSMTACGTPSWTAPEILRNESYDEKADVYSFGIVLWECISREDPYYGMPPFQVVLAVGTKGMRPTIPVDCNRQWAQLTKDCWSEESYRRPSFDQIIDRLEKLDVK